MPEYGACKEHRCLPPIDDGSYSNADHGSDVVWFAVYAVKTSVHGELVRAYMQVASLCRRLSKLPYPCMNAGTAVE